MKQKEDNIKTKIFISYSNSDHTDEYVNEIKESLSKGLKELWCDRLNLEHKGEVYDLIKNEKEIQYFILIMTESYFKSDNCMFALNELARAKETRSKCIPIITKDADIFNNSRLADYINFWNDEIKCLSEKIETNQELENKFLFEINKCSTNKVTIKYLFNFLKDVNILNEEDEGKQNHLVQSLRHCLLTKIKVDSRVKRLNEHE